MSLEICLIILGFFLVFNLVQGPLGSRTFLLLFLSLPFRGIKLILFCGPRYFGHLEGKNAVMRRW